MQVGLPHVGTMDGAADVKMVLVASGKCLAELAPLQVRMCMQMCVRVCGGGGGGSGRL